MSCKSVLRKKSCVASVALKLVEVTLAHLVEFSISSWRSLRDASPQTLVGQVVLEDGALDVVVVVGISGTDSKS